ncbi:hypothetical protein BU16DRAFT_532402 [Lophium mytilinum]|uniref:F-box domain-containing protein n=1 Tax=Lophium mytilinum TaxID=390894 RepID=A0A6A6RBN3_9PEZI|nr:hypothetical protein BU16DRAFT_532402 [Lophium mytilinum]
MASFPTSRFIVDGNRVNRDREVRGQHQPPTSPKRPPAKGPLDHTGVSASVEYTPNPLNFLFEPSRYVPMVDRIIQYLEPTDIVKLRRVHRAFTHEGYETALRTQWNINTALQRYFKSPIAFRNRLEKSSGVISGTFVLDFLDRRRGRPLIQVIVDDRSPHKDQLVAYLLEEGYTIASEDRSDESSKFAGSDWITRARYERQSSPIHQKTAISIRYTSTQPIVAILRGGVQFNTALANFVTAIKIYVPFARWTFCNSCYHTINGDSRDPWRRLLRTTGRRPGRFEYRDYVPAYWSRGLDDGRTWVIPLNTDGVDAPRQPEYVLDSTSFGARAEFEGRVRRVVDIKALQHVGLKYQWAVCDDTAFLKRLQECVDKDAMESEEEKRQKDQNLGGAQSVSTEAFVPAKFYDELVRDWLAAATETMDSGW